MIFDISGYSNATGHFKHLSEQNDPHRGHFAGISGSFRNEVGVIMN